MQHSIKQQTNANEKQQLAAQCDRLLRCYTTLRKSQPQVSGWAWTAEEPPGTTVGNLNQKVAQLEAALDAEQRCSTDSDCINGCTHQSLLKSITVSVYHCHCTTVTCRQITVLC